MVHGAWCLAPSPSALSAFSLRGAASSISDLPRLPLPRALPECLKVRRRSSRPLQRGTTSESDLPRLSASLRALCVLCVRIFFLGVLAFFAVVVSLRVAASSISDLPRLPLHPALQPPLQRGTTSESDLPAERPSPRSLRSLRENLLPWRLGILCGWECCGSFLLK